MSARKKNLVPLFGVAFIVAILSTGIFYGLFVGKLNSATTPPPAPGYVLIAATAISPGTQIKAEHLKQVPWATNKPPAGAISKAEDAVGQTVVEPIAAEELVTRAKLAAKNGGAADGASMGIPEGMRAVSLNVQDSAGVLAMLKPGHRIDVQVVGSMPGTMNNEPQLRTLLENMQVLAVPRDLQRGPGQVVTLLAAPKEAAVLGLADSTSKIRIALRNPVDQKKENGYSVGLSNVFRGQSVQSQATAAPHARPAPPPAPEQVQFLVRVAGAEQGALAQLDKQSPMAPGELQVAALYKGSNPKMDVLATSHVQASLKQEAGAQWVLDSKDSGVGLRIRFTPSMQADGKVRLRVHPEVSTPGSDGTHLRRMDTEIELTDGQSFVVRGIGNVDKLFPGQPATQPARETLVVVTPRFVRQLTASGRGMD